ncbi:MAG: RdgB/HAM1 family non-canonical purine NTP pyrophosphatase [Gammaproteobacteria bacterium]
MSASRIVLASNNPGKVREINALLQQLSMDVIPQAELGVEDAIEDGLSFIENALIKARHAALQTGLPAIADDSGLEVPALNGAPGIYSARYAGEDAGDEANLHKLIANITPLAEKERRARFVCVMVYLRHADDPVPVISQGLWEGHLVIEPVGENGFGYDPVFYVPEHQCTSAQLKPDVKNSLSHRGQALRGLLAKMQSHA